MKNNSEKSVGRSRGVYLTAEENALLDAFCARHKVTPSVFIKRAVLHQMTVEDEDTEPDFMREFIEDTQPIHWRPDAQMKMMKAILMTPTLMAVVLKILTKTEEKTDREAKLEAQQELLNVAKKIELQMESDGYFMNIENEG